MAGVRDREIRQLQKGKGKAQRKGDLKEEATLCNQLGGILAHHGCFQEALEEHRQELHLLESVDDVIGCAVAHRKIGECLAELESYEAALKHQRRHLELACSLSNHIEQQRAWATIGRTYMFMADSNDQSSEALQEAEKAFMKSLAILDEMLEGEVPQREASEMRARLYLNLGLVYDGLKNPAKHAYYIKKSIYISEQTHLYEDLYRAYFNLGNIHLREGEHSKAMRCLERARECACKMKEKYMESECYASIAQVLLSLGDFVAAKRSLKKAYLLGSQQHQQRASVCRSLRYAMKVSHLQQELEEAEAAGNLQVAVGLCEHLGDLFSKAGDYQQSVEAYEKQLCHAQSLKLSEQELAVIHFSLATTFGDLKDHVRAVKHYQAELALRRGNPLEEGKTWLHIALSKEEANESYEELERCFQTALSYAEEAGNAKVQRQILRHLHACQQRCGCSETASTLARLQDLCRSQGRHSNGEINEEEEEEEEVQSSELLEASDLELSDSDGEDDMEGYSKTVPGRRRINKWNQRNDRGETLLHRACIDGNLRQVQFLVEKGHPLNPRDYCGWTPLHEACNHGHLEIVRFLLDHSATIDDPGGPLCEGITPLHDALNCGHFDVAELLIQRGASVVLCNAKGLSPMGTLRAWVHLYGRDLDQETRQRCKAMEGLLKKALASGALGKQVCGILGVSASTPSGSKTQTRPEEPAGQRCEAELSPSPAASPLEPLIKPPSPYRSRREPHEDCMAPLRPVKKRQRLLGQDLWGGQEEASTPAAPAEYQAAIRGVGSALPHLLPSPEHPRPPSGPALIPPEEYLGEDWLEDDLGVTRGTRKRSRWSRAREEAGAEAEESPGVESDGGMPPQAPDATRRRRRRRARQSRLTQIVDRTPLGRTRGAIALVGSLEPAEPSNLRGAGGSGQVNGGTAGAGESPPLESTPFPAPPPPIRVRVQVQDNVFLIPVPHSSEGRPVSWLADQASQRYYQTCGLLPRLTLKKEGALLAPQDRIVDVLQSNEEVLAEVQSWDLPPLVERYRKACQSLAVGEHRLLLKMLEQQESGPSFSVSGVALRRLHLTPLLRALKLQTSVRRLCLSGTGLGDNVAQELLSSISTMPGLKLLDLSANQLGPEGLRKLAVGLSGPVTFQNLEELDLSVNPLGDGSTQSLASLVQACPVLSSLRLQACSLTTAFLQHYRPLLANALKGAGHLKRLSVSHNLLGSNGLELLLKSLPVETLTHLDISSVGASPGDQQPLQEAVARYLAQEGCALTHLAFSGNHLSDDATAELARCLPICLPLVSLDLSANPEIGIVGLRTLLLALEERSRGLQFLNLSGCSVRGPLDCVTWTKLSSKVCQLRLCTRHLSQRDQQGIAELWHGPVGTSLHSVTRHHKLFCQCLE
ncbi:tonsoku-like protein isoform X2 [Rhineura floridana]|uniref:tonsoku-like protein isoform X2 n=1 Tax=Rhineura floridana TaxID=261503 RepID=UPI002AC8849E|nr:tonsoku-like protein isoform X2 [Rhineura floridana]